jgi:hypothetical protein
MKKSVAFNLAQIAVMGCPNIAPENKLEILRYLMEEENLAMFVEKQEKLAAEEKAADSE